MKKQKNFYPLILLFFGALTALPFLVGKLWFISWFSLIPLAYRFFAHGDGMRLRTAFGSGYVFGMGYFGVMYHWFTAFYPMDFAGLTPKESIGVIALCWFGLSTLHSLELGTAMLVYRLVKPVKNRPYIGILTISACWATFEWLQTIGWRGVPWGRLALSQWDVLPMIQSASLFGGVFVSALMVAFNGLIAVVILKYKAHNAEDPSFIRAATDGIREVLIKAWRRVVSLFKSGTAVRVYACVAVGIFTLNLLFGVIRIAVYDETEGRAVKVAAIQGNISSLDKWADNSVSNSTSVYLELTRKAVAETGAELVLGAETAIPVMIDEYTSFKRRIANTADDLDITIIIGSFENKINPDTGELDEYNAETNTINYFQFDFLRGIMVSDGSLLEIRYYAFFNTVEEAESFVHDLPLKHTVVFDTGLVLKYGLFLKTDTKESILDQAPMLYDVPGFTVTWEDFEVVDHDIELHLVYTPISDYDPTEEFERMFGSTASATSSDAGSGEEITIEEAEDTTVEATEDTTVEATEDTTVEATEETTVEATEETTVEATEETTVEATEETTVEATEDTTVEAEASGCKSVIASASILAVMTMAAGVVVCKKK